MSGVPLLFGLLAGAVPIAVGGDDTCPRPVEVSAELALLAGDRPGRRRYGAYVEAVPGSLHIDLLAEDGARLAERDLPRRGSCAELARAAAAVIAAWLGELEAEAPLEMPAPTMAAPPAPAVAPPPATAPVATAVAAAPKLTAGAAPALATAASDPLGLWITVGLVASASGGDVAPGAELAATAAREHGRLGLRAALFATTEHAASVGTAGGEARWSRMGGGLGPALRANAAGWRVELHAALAAARLAGRGAGFGVDRTFEDAQLGGAAGVRLARPWGTGAPWVGVEAMFWPGRQQVLVGGSGEFRNLPGLDLQIGAGLSLGGGR